jgi:ribosomal protein L11 methyltransferase
VLALVVTVPSDEIELASDALWSLGVVAIEERAGAATDRVELWTSLGDDELVVAKTVASALGRWNHRVVTVDERVADTWHNFAEPTWIDRGLVVHPSWQPPPVTRVGTTAIAIDAGVTFGMGDHPTTILSLLALREAVREGSRVLDVGCGSGILAIAACRFGAAHAEAIDISPAAVPVTLSNAERNGVAERVHVSCTPLADIDDTFEVVIANILAPALITLAPDLRRVLGPEGSLIISGLLAERFQHVVEALQPLHVVSRADREGWTALTLQR